MRGSEPKKAGVGNALPPSGTLKCRFCNEPIYAKGKKKVYEWEVKYRAHVNCAKKHEESK
jgi:hypothetical protein